MGNSEVGHLNIGAGRIIYQELSRISLAIEDGSFYQNTALVGACQKAVDSGGKLHLLGLLSDGGVHSHNSHLYALVRLAKKIGVKDVCIHAIMDGRDTPPKSGSLYLEQLEAELEVIGLGRVVTVMGRYWAMDRDNRWERVKKAWQALVLGQAQTFASAREAIESAYAAGQTDEFVEPSVVGLPGLIADHDAVICFNFRADRAREITRVLALEDFTGFKRERSPQLADYVCLTEYDVTFGLPIAFASESYPDILADVIAEAGMKQLRIAETEKYAHVTFFFNGGVEQPWPGEDRVLVPSPQDVATYDQKPAMSAVEVTDEVVRRIGQNKYQLIVLNYANCDMVGHTGVLSAAIEAVETVDSCLGRVVAAMAEAGGQVLITADHGNCEKMVDEQGRPHTAHTTNPVPLIFVAGDHPQQTLSDGILADLAPTILYLLGLPKPAAMSGHSLLTK
jgi:2,3-bisphosphoglycerate-independent phosphoglycerate mutase